MRAVRRLLQVVAIVGTLLVGILAVALIVSQTPWFRDWLRRYVVRESEQYVNGQLSIGGLGGNLFFGVQLRDVALDVSGERIVAVKNVELDYSVFQILSSGMVLDEHQAQSAGDRARARRERLEPRAAGEEAAEGGRARRAPARRCRCRRSRCPTPACRSATRSAPKRYTLPKQISDLDLKAGYEYAPVHYTVTVDHLSFQRHVAGTLDGKACQASWRSATTISTSRRCESTPPKRRWRSTG